MPGARINAHLTLWQRAVRRSGNDRRLHSCEVAIDRRGRATIAQFREWLHAAFRHKVIRGFPITHSLNETLFIPATVWRYHDQRRKLQARDPAIAKATDLFDRCAAYNPAWELWQGCSGPEAFDRTEEDAAATTHVEELLARTDLMSEHRLAESLAYTMWLTH